MDFDTTIVDTELTDTERTRFFQEFSLTRKDPIVALLLALIFGGLSTHRAYLEKPFLLRLMFFWIGIPALLALIEIIGEQPQQWANEYNTQLATRIIKQIKATRST